MNKLTDSWVTPVKVAENIINGSKSSQCGEENTDLVNPLTSHPGNP